MRPKTSLSSVCPAFSGGEVSSNKHPIQNLSVSPSSARSVFRVAGPFRKGNPYLISIRASPPPAFFEPVLSRPGGSDNTGNPGQRSRQPLADILIVLTLLPGKSARPRRCFLR